VRRMATLIARGLAAGHGERALFSDLDLVVAPGDVIGLVGPNGAGKSTLLAILAGLRAPEDGGVERSPREATVGLLPQEPERRAGESVAAFLARRTGVGPAHDAMERTAAELAAGIEGADAAYGDALERWLALGGADLDERAEATASELGLGVSLDAPMTGLSGGQAARAGLASLLLSRFDALLLDEPTNDLDLDGLARLERFVERLRVGTVIVSHDREFLARTVNRVVELDLPQQRVNHYGGGYASYLEEREIARRHAREAYERYAGTRAGLEDRARVQRSWMDKGVRNARRRANDTDKLTRRTRTEASEKQASKARQSERALERLDVVDAPRREWELRMEIAAAPRAGAEVARLDGAVVERGGFVLGPVSLVVEWGDRIAITGANGAGKSTLLAALLGRTELAAGASRLGPGVVVGEIDQARGRFLGERRLLEAFAAEVPDMPLPEVRTLLAKYGLVAEHVLRTAASLSPGERTRAALALLQARGVNLLVLDEPTNHLDLPAIEQLETALDAYDGTLLLVSHDRRLLEAVELDRTIELAAAPASPRAR
jgi:ATPase subunit of ABC transporter with duplicated ATPase domains